MRRVILFVIMTGMLVLAACGGGSASIAIGPPASETNSVSKLIFEAYGITDDDYNEYQEGFGDAADMVQDGNIDISVGILGVPAGSIESLQASAGNVKMISLTEEAIKYMEENSGYLRHTITADMYDFLEEDVETVTAYAILMGSTDTISEEVGYQLAKSMVENADQNTHAQSESMTLENALQGAEDLPIHPGAKRYYEEQGLTVDNPVAELNVTEEKSDFVLGTGSQGGTYYPLGGEIATIWNNNIDGVNVTNTETGASIENLVSIRDGHLDLGMTVHVPAIDAMNGVGDFEGEGNQVTNAAFIGHIYPEVVQIVTLESSGFEGLEDIVD